MRKNKIEVYLQLVWATWDWQPWINAAMDRRVYRAISAKAAQMGCEVLAVGGIETHCHLLTTLPTTVTMADLVKQVKGASSYFVNDVIRPTTQFHWQGCYGAFSVSRWDVETIIEYIRHQDTHHRENTLLPDFEDVSMRE